MASKKLTTEERFWAKVKRLGDRECWEWMACRVHDGYGHFWDGGLVRAHRFSWVLANGPIPSGLFVLHSCDNPPCVNPDHLWVGTKADNVADMMAKGRGRWVNPEGEDHGGSILTEADVVALRSPGNISTISENARRFGVSRRCVRRAITGQSWKIVK